MIKTALTCGAALGLALAGTANAEPIRAAGSFPVVVSKAARTTAPMGRESAQRGTYKGRRGAWVTRRVVSIVVGGLVLATLGYFVFEDNGEEELVSRGG